MAAKLDLLLVNPPGKERIYQSLSGDLVAIEPPVWAGLIAQFVRRRGMSVEILDAEALGLSSQETADRIAAAGAVLSVLVVYGHQPSASTQSMPGARAVHERLKQVRPDLPTLFMGTHPAALPERTLQEERCDFVCQGEGPTTIHDLVLALKAGGEKAAEVKGLWHWSGGKAVATAPAPLIEDLDAELPGLAWDLLPMDRYRAHNWHCFDRIGERQPYASLYTSLGCPYKCSFCCINAPFGKSGIRYLSPAGVLREIDLLVTKYGVRNIKIPDEMFVLNPGHVMGICDGIIERGYDLNIWAYARIDTVQDRFMEKLKKAGFHWMAIGIESGSKHVRDGAQKSFGKKDIADVVQRIRDQGMYVGANYIFGLPDDDLQTMQETLDLAMDLNTEWANFYCAMAYPGSPLHRMMQEKGAPLPEGTGGPGWIGYSQHAFEAFPLPTDRVSAGEVLRFRDRAFDAYFSSERYLALVERTFGSEARAHVQEMARHKLRRKYAA